MTNQEDNKEKVEGFNFEHASWFSGLSDSMKMDCAMDIHEVIEIVRTKALNEAKEVARNTPVNFGNLDEEAGQEIMREHIVENIIDLINS